MDIQKIIQMVFNYELKNGQNLENKKDICLDQLSQLKNGKEEIMTSIQKEFDNDVIDIKEFVQTAKEVNSKEGNQVTFDKNFGKLDATQKKYQKKVQAKMAECAFDYACKKQMCQNYFPQENNGSRESREITNAFGPKDNQEFVEYLEILNKDNNEIEPLSGKTYLELKKNYIYNGLENIKNLCLNLSKAKSVEEYIEITQNNFQLLSGMAEMGANGLTKFCKQCKIDLESEPEMKKYLDDVATKQNYIVGNAFNRSFMGLIANPLYPYGSFDDIALACKLVFNSQLSSDYMNGIYDELDGNPDGPKLNPIEGFNGQIATIEVAKINQLQTGKGSFVNPLFQTNVKETFDIAIPHYTNTSLNNMKLYCDGEMVQKDEECEKLYQLIGEGKTIQVRDNNGKFLMNYSGKISHFYKLDGGSNEIKLIDAYNQAFDKALKESEIHEMSNYKYDQYKDHAKLKLSLEEQANAINEKIDAEVEKEIDNKLTNMSKLLAKVPKKGKDDSFKDIEELLKGVLTKKGDKDQTYNFHDNKEVFQGGLKSVRVFCQAYLDSCDINSLNKNQKKAYEAINDCYVSLLHVEDEVENIMNREKNMQGNLLTKARVVNNEYVQAIENKEIDPVDFSVFGSLDLFDYHKMDPNFETKPKVQALNVDPTINIIQNEEVSKKKDAPTLDNNLDKKGVDVQHQ